MWHFAIVQVGKEKVCECQHFQCNSNYHNRGQKAKEMAEEALTYFDELGGNAEKEKTEDDEEDIGDDIYV